MKLILCTLIVSVVAASVFLAIKIHPLFGLMILPLFGIEIKQGDS